ncbi:Planctomycete cytochrome C [Pirellula sp. SH-Sr6A]|uniref:PSD1 and planctomycete cytochrome C domain-containing protein n=1 Tax=Pirellula sp. SH-Sr6A TaxID=1632865 RepID=UPI00078B7C75|nr:PSD1 and planctomycete cytochrome C domain-containing protein [Pirellula sp. SH-Sr6A]AMV31878.1 Planctomycete cytochrome C [Pirellula sp. SH-Sr6A]
MPPLHKILFSPLLARVFASYWLASIGFAATGSMGFGADGPLRFNRDIRPLLSEYCLACHGFDASKREAGLRLDTYEGATAELDSGEIAVRPGDPDASELISRILSEDESSMMPPPESGKKLSREQKERLTQWIRDGAKYEPHWAFAKPEASLPPTDPKQVGDFANPIDAFIYQKLEQQSIAASPRASAETLLRRVYLDLIGIPPTPTEIQDFQSDYASRGLKAYTERVEQLLENPHYGEKWGRWWLDQARYADSHGYSIDAPRSIWPYRDWVIQALNDDMAFDQFTLEQIAGDLLPQATSSQIVATGFHRNTQINQEGGVDPEQFRIESIFDRVATTGTVFLGLTVGCAQCHDHKFDPITQKEYYRLFAFFNNQDEPEHKIFPEGIDPAALKAERDSAMRSLDDKLRPLAESIEQWEKGLEKGEQEKLPKPVKDALKVETKKRNALHRASLYTASLQREKNSLQQEKEAETVDPAIRELQNRIVEIDRELAAGVSTLVMKEKPEGRNTTVFIQGDFTRPDEPVQPGVPSVLHRFAPQSDKPNRLDLARWIVDRENPLTARVLVNRVWQVYFGRGIVETENDFGLQSAVPTHPELLDWLAIDWMKGGWSLKSLHRRIVCSDAYTRSSLGRSDLIHVDRDNYWLAKQNRLRLDAELVRDVGLAASGLLSPKLGGPPVFPPIPDGVMTQGQVKREWKVSQGEDRYRRGVYTFIFRATPPPSLNVFDAPEGNSSCTRRNRSNTPLQALTLLNDSAFVEFAQALSKIVEREGVEVAFQRCTSRLPTEEELAVLRQLDPFSAARVLLNLDETLTRE